MNDELKIDMDRGVKTNCGLRTADAAMNELLHYFIKDLYIVFDFKNYRMEFELLDKKTNWSNAYLHWKIK